MVSNSRSTDRRSFVFFGGGTGGHLTPALAVAQALEESIGSERTRLVFFTGGRRGEDALVRGNGAEFHDVSLARPTRRPLRFAGQSLARFDELSRFLRVRKPAACFSLGGYVSLPGALAAWVGAVPHIVLEQNRIPGKVNRLLAPLASVVCTSFPGMERELHARRVVFTGNPVRKEFLQYRGDRARRGERPWKRVAILGGSQGSQAINRAVCGALTHLAVLAPHLRFVHAAGPDHAAVDDAYRRAGLTAEVAPFFLDIARRLGDADMAICRAGGSTLAELLVLGVPALLIPYPHAADGHQEANARFACERGASTVCLEKDLTPEVIAGAVRELVLAPARWEARGRSARSLGSPDAARRVVDVALALRGGGTSRPAAFARGRNARGVDR
jgi:UDP-N-acetylglucosamine--N-acetylmuramyl-(pentapeptide) pyrophosphoryl-undecaprenol N-acetylglucosamine transferase